MNSRQAQILCLVLAVAFLIAGWWPFEPFPHNRVSWLGDRPGLSFAPPGIAYDAEPLPVPAAGPSDDATPGMAIELSLEPAMEPTNRVSHILTIHDGQIPSSLAIVQWKSELLVRVPASGNPRGFREIGIGALRTHEAHNIVISSDSTATTFYVDGRLSLRVPKFVLGPETTRGRLLLGNAATGKSAWSGKLFGVAIFNRALAAKDVSIHQQIWTQGNSHALSREPGLAALYSFTEGGGQRARDGSPAQHTLLIPSRSVVLQKTVLDRPANVIPRNWHATRDVLLNVVGFVPFGVFAFLSHHRPSYVRRVRAAITATLAGAAVSLIIELGQVWLPSRYSTVLDLICNTAGTAVGVLLCWMVSSTRHRPGTL